MSSLHASSRTPIAYLAPWVDFGGSDKGTLDWFRWLDRARYAPSLITTQPSDNRRLPEVVPFAEEVWPLPDMLAGMAFPWFIFDFLHTRRVEVMHIMNSRLAFDLLPDLGNLPHPPAVVVQLHVEEQDRSGYVRYVTTRYGNLVDAFSVTSDHLAAAVEGYDVPRSKIHVIRTGVDAQGEFSPDRVMPRAGLEAGRFRILYPGRLVAQKDPLLMVEAVAALRATHENFRVHVVGEGELEPAVRRAVRERGLESHVALHPAAPELAPWYAAADALLMTSVFEGVPYVAYEALAMGLPVVAPALPGNRELVGDTGGLLVEPRDDVAGYARALGALIDDPAGRRSMGAAGRERMLAEHSLRAMAERHEALYDDLRAQRAPRPGPFVPPPPPPRIALRERPPRERPPVSVVVPCYDHGRYLPACLASIAAQSYPELEVIVVDDGSTEPETVQVLVGLEADEQVRLLRIERNAGPSAARNLGLEAATGRYVLFVDADNLLMEGAVARLVDQLASCGERVGFIYPNLQFFGNRDDYFEAPAYDLFNLLGGNYCDTGSLFDRQVFDAGVRFDESISLGHEDWDLMLTLADRGVTGEPANGPTLLYRKHGFTRSDRVEYSTALPRDAIRARHLSLFGEELFASPAVDVKATWSPAVSVVALGEVSAGTEQAVTLAGRLAGQSCRDFEYIAAADRELTPPGTVPAVRRLPPALAANPARRLEHGLQVARGAYVFVLAGTGTTLLSDAAAVDKVLRVFAATPDLDAVVLADAGVHRGYSLRLIAEAEKAPAAAGVAFRIGDMLAAGDEWLVTPGREVDSIIAALDARGAKTQWRHVAAEPTPTGHGAPGPQIGVSLRRPRSGREAGRDELGRAWPPSIPTMPPGTVRRWADVPTWMPPEPVLLTRHREAGGERRVVTLDVEPPEGFELEYFLGVAKVFPVPGTMRLYADDEAGYVVAPPGTPPPGRREDDALACVEQTPFPLLDALILGRLAATGQHVMTCGETDPLHGGVEPLATLGFLESYPAHPRRAPHASRAGGGLGLVRTVDRSARRHRYGVGEVPRGEVVGELGALAGAPPVDGVPVWVTADGRVVTPAHAAGPPHPAPAAAGRWALAPLNWPGDWNASARLRASARRSAEAALAVAKTPAPPASPRDDPAGWLLSAPRSGTRPLFSAIHPVTGDQLLTTAAVEAGDMGYGPPVLLGHLLAHAPVTGRLELGRVAVPWASRFGAEARRR